MTPNSGRQLKFGNLGHMVPMNGQGLWWSCPFCPFRLNDEGGYASANFARRKRHLLREHGMKAPPLPRSSLLKTSRMKHALKSSLELRWRKQWEWFQANAWPGSHDIEFEGKQENLGGKVGWVHKCKRCGKSLARYRVPESTCALHPDFGTKKVPPRAERQRLWKASKEETHNYFLEERAKKVKRPMSRAQSIKLAWQCHMDKARERKAKATAAARLQAAWRPNLVKTDGNINAYGKEGPC